MTSITSNIAKRQIRYDLEIIAKLIKPNSKVLDIGCGDGELLDFLKKTKNVDARGLEISQAQVSQALMRGLSVIQGDAENDLSFYPNHNFDFAILSQTIQATQKPKKFWQKCCGLLNLRLFPCPILPILKTVCTY
jgi:methionine biosynthesis protein MetW